MPDLAGTPCTGVYVRGRRGSAVKEKETESNDTVHGGGCGRAKKRGRKVVGVAETAN